MPKDTFLNPSLSEHSKEDGGNYGGKGVLAGKYRFWIWFGKRCFVAAQLIKQSGRESKKEKTIYLNFRQL
jgi:hypothetical protein